MKFLIPVDTKDLNARISKLFGFSPHFLVIDSETTEHHFTDGVNHEEPNHGLDRFANQDIDRVIVRNIGPQAYEDVTDMGWTVYSCHGMTLNEAIEKVKNDEVQILGKPTMKVSIHDRHSREKDK